MTGPDAPAMGAVAYRARPGDTLGAIARRFGVAQRRTWNPEAITGLKEGQTLRVVPRPDEAA
jgi:LysM repeat protein